MLLTGSCFPSESAPRPLPSRNSRTKRTNLCGGLADTLTAGPSRHAISPHPSSREEHHSTVRWSSSFLLLGLILHCHAAAASCWEQNSVPSIQMRRMITANRRADLHCPGLEPGPYQEDLRRLDPTARELRKRAGTSTVARKASAIGEGDRRPRAGRRFFATNCCRLISYFQI